MPTPRQSSSVRLVAVDRDHGGQRLDNFLSSLMKGVPKAAVYRMIRTGQVRVNGGRCKPSTRLEMGDEVRVPPARIRDDAPVDVSAEVRQQLRAAILFENRDLIVVDKPSGIAVHAGSGLRWGLIEALRQDRPGEYLELAHRLDRDTSGCLVLARSGAALAHVSALFRDGGVRKRYLCLMDGQLREALVTVDAPLARADTETRGPIEVHDDGKPSLTQFRLLESYEEGSYAEAELHTGRTHQIRAHARYLDAPLAGDRKYAGRESLKKWKALGLNRMFLHAHRLGFPDVDGQPLEFNAPLPEPLRRVLDALTPS